MSSTKDSSIHRNMLYCFITVYFPIRLYYSVPLHFTRTFSFDVSAISEPNFIKPILFTCKNEYHALVRMVISHLNCQTILLLKRPLTHY